jgi:hypothetical protein
LPVSEVVVEFVAIEAVALGMLVVELHGTEGRNLVHFLSPAKDLHRTVLRGPANIVGPHKFQAQSQHLEESMEDSEILAG